MKHRHLKRAVQPIGWSRFRGGLGAVAQDSKCHWYGGETYDEARGLAKVTTLCGTTIPRAALPGAPTRGRPFGSISPQYPYDLERAAKCGRCEGIKDGLGHQDDNGRPIDGGA